MIYSITKKIKAKSILTFNERYLTTIRDLDFSRSRLANSLDLTTVIYDEKQFGVFASNTIGYNSAPYRYIKVASVYSFFITLQDKSARNFYSSELAWEPRTYETNGFPKEVVYKDHLDTRNTRYSELTNLHGSSIYIKE